MRLKQISDQAACALIRKQNKDILVQLFERNLVDVLNLFDKHNRTSKEAQHVLAQSVVVIWEYFSSHPWLAAKHKLDFMVDYVNRQQLSQILQGSPIKLKSSFVELDELWQSALTAPDAKNIVVNNFKALSDLPKEILQLTYFEKLDDEAIAAFLGKSEEYIERKKLKTWETFMGMISQHALVPLKKELIQSHLDEFNNFYLGRLAKDRMLALELSRSTDPNVSKAFEQFESLIDLIRAIRRESLVKFILTNSSTKLTGNIWGKAWTYASAGFIGLMGFIMWYAKQNPPVQSAEPKIKIETTDTTTQKSIQN